MRTRKGIIGPLIILAGIALCGLFLILYLSGVRQQRKAAQAIRAAGGRFYYDCQEGADGAWPGRDSWVPVSWRRRLGADWGNWFHPVGYVHFEGSRANDATLAEVSKLPRVKLLGLWDNTNVTERGYASIGHMKNLTWLSLQHSHLDDAGLRHLTGLKKLKGLELNNTLITDNSVEDLKKFPQIKELWISGTKISKAVGRKFEASYPLGVVDY